MRTISPSAKIKNKAHFSTLIHIMKSTFNDCKSDWIGLTKGTSEHQQNHYQFLINKNEKMSLNCSFCCCSHSRIKKKKTKNWEKEREEKKSEKSECGSDVQIYALEIQNSKLHWFHVNIINQYIDNQKLLL
jgi:hypothetical protein